MKGSDLRGANVKGAYFEGAKGLTREEKADLEKRGAKFD
jgi:uncharacterized protein YjbI with pentapeptide repeats